jgi:putative hydrolase of HD superfamily
MNPDLPKLESFLKLLHETEKVKRRARRPDEREPTSTAEHTFEVAMLCWYLASVNKLDLDFEKVLKYALAHDLIEAYAGDTPIYDTAGRKTKEAREHAAHERIKEEFAEFADLLHTIETYERRADPEANFVYAADKLIDPLNAGMEEKQSIWKEFNVSWDMLLDYKTEKIAKHPTVFAYWQALVKKLEAKKDFFFNS